MALDCHSPGVTFGDLLSEAFRVLTAEPWLQKKSRHCG